MKWIKYGVGGLAILIAGFLVLVRLYVGAVNTPIGDYEFSSTALENQIQLPEGFTLGVYGAQIPNARMLRFSRAGDLLVANPNLGQILILARDADGDGRADGTSVLIAGLNGPNGLDFFEEYLYIAETDAIGRVPFDHERGELAGDYERLVTGLPGGGNHWKKTLRFGPDGLMYVTFGSSCNVCIESDERRATMLTYQPDGTDERIFARGLRNSAGFDWSPDDGHLYATDNGRDMLGDDYPPCELNKVVQGAHYGWPFANGNKDADPDLGEDHPELVQNSEAPVHGFRPHNAPLGMEFVRGDGFPEQYRGAAIVALHGSWNRSDKDGYKVVSLHWDSQGNVQERDFVTGFLNNDEVIGRPAEVTQGPDGAFYISDDYAGVVYRVAYGEAQPSLAGIGDSGAIFDRAQTLAAYTGQDWASLNERGQQLYDQFDCASCHASGQSSMKELLGLGDRYDVPLLMQFLSKPRDPMPLFPLTDEDREALAVYLIDTNG
ncbi:MAG: PQQ-dependent sugar dehydrogenase [Proteobacteria bacterium]|nr:PQQ-dependent sugar dehydrogenase [Pseudomonadota bacterium]MDA1300881.1 PQQ-dependent sugar dehydrogenase [Pseudomonadota bacterium]